jgi:glucokinase
MTGATRAAIGIDLGATQVRAAIVDESGEVLVARSALTDPSGPEGVVRQIRSLVGQVSAQYGDAAVRGVGLCAPGPLDSGAGLVLDIPTLPGWKNIPIAQWMSDVLSQPVTLENDGIAAAIGEWRFGAGRGLKDFVYVTVSTGIGGGVICDGHVLRGRRGMASHLGHMTTHPDGATCACGNRGCWEAQASGTALAVHARRAIANRPESVLAVCGDALDARQIVDAARAGDQLARELVSREAELLAIGLTNLLHLYSPSAIVIGGGVSHGFDVLADDIRRHIVRRAMPDFREVPIVAAHLGQQSGLVGAASLVLFGRG